MGKAQVKVEAKETTKMVVLSLFTLSLTLNLNLHDAGGLFSILPGMVQTPDPPSPPGRNRFPSGR